ncbi:MAG: citramalate synthase [Candidatus Omnitrophica bacterium]|nr:citramalate synthase [Candidatus Omnitrophota bacterium]MCM8798922.1 citramalate synthase [Candidatus Omnitrophota bacterium]
MKEKVLLYDTTLRDGAQKEGVSFSVEDKLRIAQKLDELGVHYLEGGWPGSNPKDIRFFQEMKSRSLKRAKLVAFGSTRKKRLRPEQDDNLQELIKAGTSVVTIFGKSWDLQVKYALQTTLEENLKMIFESVKFLKSFGLEVIYDAEHFFDGFKANPHYALTTLEKAASAGADNLTLCDTNGGTLVEELCEIIREVKKRIKKPLGIHCHNDAELAVANSLSAVKLGVVLVQGTINGYGERCGNANLCSIIANLKLKMGIDCITDKQLANLTEISRFVSEVANIVPRDETPFVGLSAFTHKGGVHVSAVQKHPRTYEHVSPEKVGNRRRILISELSGKSALLSKAKEFKIDIAKDPKAVKKVLSLLKDLEYRGYQFEGAEGSFEVLLRKAKGEYDKFFDLEGFRVIVEKDKKGLLRSEATIKVKVGNQIEHTAAEGDGPVNALDNALRKALEKFYPDLKEMKLSDFKVRVIDAEAGTAAKVRVLIESRDGKDEWNTVGVSENIIEASWQALVDGIEYKLLKDKVVNRK